MASEVIQQACSDEYETTILVLKNLPSNPMRIGIGSYALAWSIGVPGHLMDNPLDTLQFLDMAKKSGAQCVQIADNINLLELSQQDLERIKSKALQLSLPIEIGMRGLIYSDVMTYVKLCQFFQSPILRVVIDRPGYEPPIDSIVSLIRNLLPTLSRLGVKLAIENHDRFSAAEFVHIVKATDPLWVGICLDSVNSLGRGEGFDYVAELLLPFTINVHIKDYRIIRKKHQMGFDVEGTIAGQGMLPIQELLRTLQEGGRCQSAILELWPAPEETLVETISKERRWLGQSMQYLLSL